MTQFCRFTLQELANALARAVQTDGHADIVEPLILLKTMTGPFLRVGRWQVPPAPT